MQPDLVAPFTVAIICRLILETACTLFQFMPGEPASEVFQRFCVAALRKSQETYPFRGVGDQHPADRAVYERVLYHTAVIIRGPLRETETGGNLAGPGCRKPLPDGILAQTLRP